MIDVVELLQHWHAGRRIGELSSSLGVDPKRLSRMFAQRVSRRCVRLVVGGVVGRGRPI